MTKLVRMQFRLGVVWCVLFLGWIGGIACSQNEPPKGPCKTNADCAGSTICNDGKCVFPQQESIAQEKQQEITQEAVAEREPVVEREPVKEPVDEPRREAVDASEPAPESTEPVVEGARDTPPDTDVGCKTGDTRPCYSGPKDTEGKGECQAGVQRCRGGFWDVACEGEVLPSREECNGKDDDCNGQIDESFPEDGNTCKLTGKLGPCAQGKYICQADQLVCQVTYQPKAEDCSNKIDDDCDGKIDGPPCTCNPGETRECFTGDPNQATQGECQKGRQTCDSKGQWGSCQGEQLPVTETCNGKDDDCDGQVDETFPEKGSACTDTTKQGICQQGSYTACTNGVLVCTSQVQPAAQEICANGKDDNCDGNTDENPPCQCQPGQTRSCYTGAPGTDRYTPCKRGTQTCDSNGQWGTCSGQVVPQRELCDNIDNDCNGRIDDNLQRSCTSNCGKGTEVCEAGKYVKCSAPQPTAEICDGKDNDCDGYIDNNQGVKQSYSLTQSCSNRCGKGVETCSSSAKWVNCTAPTATTETCNNKDDDCDGVIDDNLYQECFDTGQSGCIYNRSTLKWECKGTCQTGRKICTAGVYSTTCSGDIGAVTEVCRDGKDNDCDGLTDEICGAPFTYASVSSTGTFYGQRYFTAVKRSSTGTYSLAAISGYGCDQRPLFVTANTTSMRPVSFACSGSTFIVNTGAHATRNGTREDSNFFAVVPRRESDTTWGLVNCISSIKKCSVTQGYGSFTATSVGLGVVDITSTPCKNATGPIFSTIYHSKIAGYAVAYSNLGKCRIRTYGLDGSLIDLPFAFWAPNPKTAAWATISSTGSVSSSYDFGDSRAKWSSKLVTGRGTHYEVLFPAWSKTSAALVTPRLGLPYDTSAIPSSGGIRVYSHEVTSAGSKSTPFNVMFVQ